MRDTYSQKEFSRANSRRCDIVSLGGDFFWAHQAFVTMSGYGLKSKEVQLTNQLGKPNQGLFESLFSWLGPTSDANPEAQNVSFSTLNNGLKWAQNALNEEMAHKVGKIERGYIRSISVVAAVQKAVKVGCHATNHSSHRCDKQSLISDFVRRTITNSRYNRSTSTCRGA